MLSLARRSTAALALALTIAGLHGSADAAPRDEKEACVAASDQAQTLRDEGKFRRAREALLVCARDACPGIVRKDCEKWLADLDASYPTVVLGARDAKGRDVSGVRVFVDGALLTDRLDGKPVQIEPGEHQLRYEAPGIVTSQERVVVRVGEKNRAITAQLQPLYGDASGGAVNGSATSTAGGSAGGSTGASGNDASAADTTVAGRSRSPALALVLGGVGIAAIGSFAYFGVTGKADINELRTSCAPSCAQRDVDAAKTKLLVADISLGVGVVALIASAWVFLAHGSSSSAAPAPSAARLDVRALPGGGVASVGGAF